MIVSTVTGDVLKAEEKHIVFATNVEGLNDSGFAGIISEYYWPELENVGKQDLGTVISKKVNQDLTLHAIVCHSLTEGWGIKQKEVIQECFDNIDCAGETIASVAIGAGLIGKLTGANSVEIMKGMEKSNKKIVLYQL